MKDKINTKATNIKHLRLPLFGNCSILTQNFTQEFRTYSYNSAIAPLLMLGNAVDVLKQLPDESIDCCMTSPPYWRKRQYEGGGIGFERNFRDYISNLCLVFA
ncbi:MAG: hypothetical protein RLP02_24195 [Coleofasciculus sp. C2-GNP5-27]